MDVKPPSTDSLAKSIDVWLDETPTALLDALLRPADAQLVLDSIYRSRLAAQDQPATSPSEVLDKRLRVRIAIQAADLRCRAATGQPLHTVREYERYRQQNSPSRAMIYSAYGTWPFALLAAREAEHSHYANRRARGGDRRTAEFTPAQCERALLQYAEQHAGLLPSESDWARWTRGRPDQPSISQIKGRTAAGAERTLKEAHRQAAARALNEEGWPLTRARLQLDAKDAR